MTEPIDEKKAIEIVDESLDNDIEMDSQSTRLLAQWVKSSPDNADAVFKRFLLHVLLKDHYQQKTYSDLLQAGGLLPGAPLSRGALILTLLRKYLPVLLVLILALGGLFSWSILSKESLPNISHYDYNFDYFKVGRDSVWGSDYKPPLKAEALLGHRYELFSGYSWLNCKDKWQLLMMGSACCAPASEDYIFIESGRFLIDNTTGDGKFTVELLNVIITPGKSRFCVAYNKEYSSADIYVLTGTLELAAKADFFDYYELSADEYASVTIDDDGLRVADERENINYFGPLLSMQGGADFSNDLTPTFAYEAFDYQRSETKALDSQIKLHGRNGGWGWSGPWRELGGLDSTIIYEKEVSQDDQRQLLAYADQDGTTLAAMGGQLQTADGSHCHCQRRVATNIVPPALLDGEFIGKDNSVLWLSFMAQSVDRIADDDHDAYVYLGRYNQGLMLGKSSRIKTGNWALECNIDNDNRAFRIDNNYYCDQKTLFVVRIVFLPGEEQVAVWLDPPLSHDGKLPDANLIESVPDFRFNELGVYSRSSTDFDELRLGTSFKSVTTTKSYPDVHRD